MDRVTAIINGKECVGEKGEFLLQMADRNGIAIPRLCHHESLRGLASCRLCLAEVTENGRKRIVTSCIFPVMRDITAETETEEIRRVRQTLFGFLLAEAPGNEPLLAMAGAYGDISRYEKEKDNACVVCGLCVKACAEIGPNCIGTIQRGTYKKVAPPFEEAPENCIGCAACAQVCPTGHIRVVEEGGTRKIWGAQFEMIRCEVCGQYFMTKEQFAYIARKTEKAEPPVCADCQRAAVAQKWMGNKKYEF
jgi:NADH dehydrogenase/NADH:ubiquinone oxidoreductase subunit G